MISYDFYDVDFMLNNFIYSKTFSEACDAAFLV